MTGKKLKVIDFATTKTKTVQNTKLSKKFLYWYYGSVLFKVIFLASLIHYLGQNLLITVSLAVGFAFMEWAGVEMHSMYTLMKTVYK